MTSLTPKGAQKEPPALPRRLGLKYCGGCAPRFDRVAVVNELAKKLNGITLFASPQSDTIEAILVVAGCPTCCVEIEKTGRYKRPILRVRSEEDARLFLREMIESPGQDFASSALAM